MGLPTSQSLEYRGRYTVSGIQVDCYPSTVAGLTVELQSATASAAASSLWNSIILGPSSASRLRHTYQIPESTKTVYFKARHPAQPGYSAGPFTPIASAQPKRFALKTSLVTPDVRFSTPWNGQGSIVPSPISGTWAYNANAGTAFGAIAWSWAARTIYLPDGSTITVPASSSMTVPSSPSTGTVAGGALGGRTYKVRTAFLKTQGATRRIYGTSAEATQIVGANNLLTVTAPANPGGYDSWCVLIGTVADQEFTQGAGNITTIAFGTNYTEPVGGASTSGTTPFSTQWTNKVVECYLGFSTVYYFYPYWDLAFAAAQPNNIGIVMGAEAGLTAASLVSAQAQIQDGRIGMSFTVDSTNVVGYIKATSAAASGTGSGSGLGGKF